MIVLRKQQEYIVSKITEAINNEDNILIEAGTGTGKTLSYLIPVILYILNTNNKVVISTNTINLQEQILNKDIKLAFSYLGEEVKYRLVKGRNNYICIMRFSELYKNKESLSPVERNELENIKEWVDNTTTGDKTEYKGKISNHLWDMICSSKHYPIPRNSNYYEKCFYNKSRQEMENSNLYILNHHLLFSDIAIKEEGKKGILPNYDVIIFDEAHNLEDVTRTYYSEVIKDMEIMKNSGYIYDIRFKQNPKYTSLYTKLISVLEESDIELPCKDEFIEVYENIYATLLEIFKILKNSKNESVFSELFFKLYSKNIDIFYKLEKINSNFEKLIDNLIEYYEMQKKCIDAYNILEEYNGVEILQFVLRMEEYISSLKTLSTILKESFCEIENQNIDYVYWYKLNDFELEISKTPISVSKQFKKSIIDKKKSLVFMSATMTTNNNMKYFKDGLGLEDTIDINIKSPFDYEKQIKFYILSEEANDEIICDRLTKYIKRANGKTLILFTSYNYLEKYYDLIKKRIDKSYVLFKQGDLSRTEIINQYKKLEKSVIFGTDSFWEGIDIKGNKLSNVIIHKLPFKVPTDPIFYKRDLILKMNRRNSFNEIQIPYSILKLKQGIGRLIRSEEDKGNILILDSRLINKSYGKVILNSLDYVKHNVISLEDIDEI